MRTSSRKTTAAVLRSIVGIKDFEMAELLECSPATIHSIESGRLRLSEPLATKMFHETGVSPGWLLRGNPKKAPEAANGEPYTKAVFEYLLANKIYSDRVQGRKFSADFLGFAGRLR